MAAALLCVASALLRPEWPQSRTVYHYTFVFDITQSMNTRDQTANGQVTDRLGLAKQAVQHTLEHLPCGSTVGLGLYTANNTYQLFTPLEVCGHYGIISQVLRRINWRMAWENDSYIQYGLYAAIYLLVQNDPPPRLVLISDGEQSPKLDRGDPAFMGKPGLPGGLLVGVGSDIPGPVPHLDADNQVSGYWTEGEALGLSLNDPLAARPYLSRLDEANLKKLAGITGMGYYRLQDVQGLNTQLQDKAVGQKQVVQTDMRWLFAGLALVFLLLSGVGAVMRPTPKTGQYS